VPYHVIHLILQTPPSSDKDEDEVDEDEDGCGGGWGNDDCVDYYQGNRFG